jgi:alpha-methylacyl-CoA racemase
MPVLDLEEAPDHPQNRDREAFVKVGDTTQPAPAPRFSRTPSEIRDVAPRPGQGGAAALADWGFGPDEIERLRARGACQ